MARAKLAGIVPTRQNADNANGQTSEQPKVGRPATGRRSDPDYRQVSVWVRKDTYKLVESRLFNDEDEREVSDLMQELFEEWLKRKPAKKSTK